MTITLNLPQDVEDKVLAEAQAQGVPLNEFIQNILLARVPNREAIYSGYKPPTGRKSLAQLFAESPLKGLDLDFSRSQDTGRPVDL